MKKLQKKLNDLNMDFYITRNFKDLIKLYLRLNYDVDLQELDHVKRNSKFYLYLREYDIIYCYDDLNDLKNEIDLQEKIYL